MPHPLSTCCQCWKQRYESSNHALCPGLFHGPLVLKLGSSSNDSAPAGHASAHFLHFLQNSTNPKSTGLSQAIGRSVKTLHRRTAGPNSGVTSLLRRLSSPMPASTANGTLSAVSFTLGMA